MVPDMRIEGLGIQYAIRRPTRQANRLCSVVVEFSQSIESYGGTHLHEIKNLARLRGERALEEQLEERHLVGTCVATILQDQERTEYKRRIGNSRSFTFRRTEFPGYIVPFTAPLTRGGG